MPPRLPFDFSETEGEVVGIFAGVAAQYYDKKRCQYEVNIHFGNKARDYAHYVKSLFEKMFEKKFRLNKNGPTTLRLQTYSKDIYQHFHKYLEFVPSSKHNTVMLTTLDVPQEFKIGFLRGFVDTDGCIRRQKPRNKIQIIFTTTSKRLAQQISSLLHELNIQSGMYSQDNGVEKIVYRVRIRQASVQVFLQLVNPYKCRQVSKLYKQKEGPPS